MNANPFAAGSPVLVIGQICTVKTCIGLFGYVDRVWSEADARDGRTLSITLLSLPTLEAKEDKLREKRGDFQTWSALAKPSDLRPLTRKTRLARVAALMVRDEKKKREEKRDPKLDALLDELSSPEYLAKEKRERAKIAVRAAEMGQVFTLPGCIKRGDKSRFPAYSDPITRKIDEELRGYADKGPNKCTIDERVRWGQALEATESTSFWSSREECRAVVKELDLDPMTDGYEAALWRDKGKIYVRNGDLRREAIRLWNRDAIIQGITDMENEDTCWSDWRGTEPAGFLIYFAFRRKLPQP